MSIGVWMSLPDKTGLHVLIDQDAYYEAAPVVQKVNVVTDEVLAARRDDVAGVVRALDRHLARLRQGAGEVGRRDGEGAARRLAREPRRARQDLRRELERQRRPEQGGARVHRPNGPTRARTSRASARSQLAEWVDFSLVDEVLEDREVHRGSMSRAGSERMSLASTEQGHARASSSVALPPKVEVLEVSKTFQRAGRRRGRRPCPTCR